MGGLGLGFRLGLEWRLGLPMPFFMGRTIAFWRGFLQVGSGFL
jgi:hypothetical protein